MLKTLFLVFAASLGTTTAFFFAGPITLYSGFQGKFPFGSGIKVLPDGTNIWSWHHTQVGDGVTEVVVDFDNNGRMDTENHCFRVLVTDMQARYFWQPSSNPPPSIFLLDDSNTVLWDMSAGMQLGPSPSYHLATPLAVPIGSKLRIAVSHINTNTPMYLTLIGRIVNL